MIEELKKIMRKVGRANENLFAKYSHLLNWTRTPEAESKKKDIKDHIDQVYKDSSNNIVTIQIKDERHEHMGGPVLKDKVLCLELRNVNGNTGSINGKYKYFVYRLANEFLIYNRTDLITGIEKLVKFEYVQDFKQARLKLYNRGKDGRQDITTLIPISDLESINIKPTHIITISDADAKRMRDFYFECFNSWRIK